MFKGTCVPFFDICSVSMTHGQTVHIHNDVILQNSEQSLQDALRETDEETQICARELLQLIDSISDYKEFVEASTAGMKKDLYECVDDIASLSDKRPKISVVSH